MILFNAVVSNNNPNTFVIDRGASSSGPWTQLLSSSQDNDSEGSIHELGGNTTAAAFYRLTFNSNHGGSPYRIDEIFLVSVGQTQSIPPPGPPTSVSAVAVSDNQITVSWNPPSSPVGISSYNVDRCQGSGCTTFAFIQNIGQSPLFNIGLSSNTTYRYQISAIDSLGQESAHSSITEATTLEPVTTVGLVGGRYVGGRYGKD